MTKSSIATLSLVYPPLSSQEATWLREDPEVEAILRRSDFYMIAGRAEASFQDIICDPEARTITFRFAIGDSFSDTVRLELNSLKTTAKHAEKEFVIEGGPKLFRIWAENPKINPAAELLDWFTTEKLLYDRSRGAAGIVGFDQYRQATTYDLLYVGIAKKGDTFDRLFDKAHKARMDILSNEPQRYPGARVTDEIYLFAFAVEPLIMTTFEHDHVFDETSFDPQYEPKRIVADAEKAFVSLLKPQYNVERFEKYPKGKDGLYGSDLRRYGYSLVENLTFNTAHQRFRGGLDTATGFISNDGDAIFVEGDTVKLYVSGVDFPADYGASPPTPEAGPST